MNSARFSLQLAGRLTAGAIVWMSAVNVWAQEPAAGENFPGVQKALSPEQYSATGLGKLSPAERVNLDNYLRGYFNGATQRVAQKATEVATAKAVDQAVKEHKVEPPQLIETHMVGTISSWKSDQVFTLENGQHWKVIDNSDRHFAPVTNPDVFIVRDTFGYKMAIAGGGSLRVKRMQ